MSHFLILIYLPLSYCTSTMVTVWGTPVIKYIPKNAAVSTQTWDDCVDGCSVNETCIAVHGDPDGVCTVYSSGDLYSVKNEKAANTGNKVSFKIPTPPSECAVNVADMMLGANLIPGSTYTTATFTVTTTTDEYAIKYAFPGVDATCNDWLMGTPQCSPCNTMMLAFPASFGTEAITFTGIYEEGLVTRDCLMKCWLDENCFLTTHYGQNYCNYYKYGGDIQFKKIENPAAGTDGLWGMVGIKLTFDTDTCSKTLDETLSGQVFTLPSSLTTYTSVKLRTDSGTGFVRLEYGKESIDCSTDTGVTVYAAGGCYQVMKANLNYADARAQCLQLGGLDLMSVPGSSKFYVLYDAWGKTSTILPGKVHLGLTRADESSSWEWSIPTGTDSTSFAWASGQPGTGNCAWMVTGEHIKSMDPYLESHDCADLGDGYICYKAS